MEKVIKIFNSFEEQEEEEKQYWKNLSGEKKLEILEYIRLQYWAMKNDSPPEFERIYRITERKL